MKDEATLGEILRLIRDLWSRTDAATVARLVHTAIDPAIANDEISSFSDTALLQSLRAMTFFAAKRSDPVRTVTVEHLAALDQARDYGAASTYNWLRSELQKVRDAIVTEGKVCVADETGGVIFSSVAEFDAWAGRRYPHA